MNVRLRLLISLSLGFAAVAAAQTPAPSSTQTRPDARYPNPSGQDSNPGQTRVKPTKPAPDPRASATEPSTGEKSKDTYAGAEGRKRDNSMGCSTPTEARDAHKGAAPSSSGATSAGNSSDSKNAVVGSRANRQIVCTTSGANSSSARELRVSSKSEGTHSAPASTPSPR
jgi:hypothetical protein